MTRKKKNSKAAHAAKTVRKIREEIATEQRAEGVRGALSELREIAECSLPSLLVALASVTDKDLYEEESEVRDALGRLMEAAGIEQPDWL